MAKEDNNKLNIEDILKFVAESENFKETQKLVEQGHHPTYSMLFQYCNNTIVDKNHINVMTNHLMYCRKCTKILLTMSELKEIFNAVKNKITSILLKPDSISDSELILVPKSSLPPDDTFNDLNLEDIDIDNLILCLNNVSKIINGKDFNKDNITEMLDHEFDKYEIPRFINKMIKQIDY